MEDSAGAQRQITAFWSAVASVYEAHPGNVPARGSSEHRAWVDAIGELLPPAPADVLDIATGTGFAATIAASLGHRVTGIDASCAMLREARTNVPDEDVAASFALMDAVEPAFRERSFDAIITRHFVWTLREPERAFGNWCALLRPGGRLVIIDGFWSVVSEDNTEDNGPNLFDAHYTLETRAALPAMRWSSTDPLRAMLIEAGFPRIVAGDLAAVHAVAKQPPSAEPWYVVVAKAPD